MHSLFAINISLIIFLHVFGENVINTTETITVGMCPKEMRLFPRDDNSTDLICDCSIPGYLYFLETDSCYEAYTQGPCLPEHYLVLPPLENLAKCEKNPCLQDGLVPYNGSCAELHKRGPPCIFCTTMSVDPNTFEIKCIPTSTWIITAPPKKCPPGSRRNALGVCKRVLV